LPHTLLDPETKLRAADKAGRLAHLADSFAGDDAKLNEDDYEAARNSLAMMREDLPGLTDEQLIDVCWHICNIGRSLALASLSDGDMPSVDSLTLIWGQSVIAGEVAKGLS
jgi:hypothetical protein